MSGPNILLIMADRFRFYATGLNGGPPLLPTNGYSNRGCYGEAMDKIGNKEKDTDQPIYSFRRNSTKIIYKKKADVWEMYDLYRNPQEAKNIVDTSAEAELF